MPHEAGTRSVHKRQDKSLLRLQLVLVIWAIHRTKRSHFHSGLAFGLIVHDPGLKQICAGGGSARLLGPLCVAEAGTKSQGEISSATLRQRPHYTVRKHPADPNTPTNKQTNKPTSNQGYKHTYKHTYKYTNMLTYMHMHTHACTHIHTYTCACTPTHTHTQTDTHTHTTYNGAWGMRWHGAWHGAWHGMGHGIGVPCGREHGMEHGAWRTARGMARGMESAWHGMAWHGMARHSIAWHICIAYYAYIVPLDRLGGHICCSTQPIPDPPLQPLPSLMVHLRCNCNYFGFRA